METYCRDAKYAEPNGLNARCKHGHPSHVTQASTVGGKADTRLPLAEKFDKRYPEEKLDCLTCVPGYPWLGAPLKPRRTLPSQSLPLRPVIRSKSNKRNPVVWIARHELGRVGRVCLCLNQRHSREFCDTAAGRKSMAWLVEARNSSNVTNGDCWRLTNPSQSPWPWWSRAFEPISSKDDHRLGLSEHQQKTAHEP